MTDRPDLYSLIDSSDPERPRGALTKHDRRFLLDRDGTGARAEMSDGAIRQKRYKIRERLENALLDLQYLDPHELQMDTPAATPSDPPEAARSAWVGLAMDLLQTAHGEHGRETFLDMVADEIKSEVAAKYIREHNVYAEPEVTVDVERPDPDDCPSLFELKEQYEDGEEIPFVAELALSDMGMHPDPESVWPDPDDLDDEVQDPVDHDPVDADLMDAAVEAMDDLDDGDGADRGEVVATVVDRHDVTEDAAEQAIQDALLTGQCFEPDGGSLKVI